MPASAERAARLVACRRRTCEERCHGFTLLELLLVVALLGTLSALAVPLYFGYLEKSKVARAIVEIRSFGRIIDLYKLDTGALPDTLAQAGAGMPTDLWGSPYEYLKIACEGSNSVEGENKGGKDKKGKDKSSKCDPPDGARRDRFLKPLNSDYDLYTKGKNLVSKPQLKGKDSRDDILRAIDGTFVGLASEF